MTKTTPSIPVKTPAVWSILKPGIGLRYIAEDGSEHYAKADAENHDRKQAIKRKLEDSRNDLSVLTAEDREFLKYN